MTKLYTYQQSPAQGQIVAANPESTYTVSDYPYGQGGTYSSFVQSGGKVLSIDPYRMAYYARNWSGNNPAFAAFICCRGASDGTYVAFWATNLVCKVGYALSHNTGTAGIYMQTDGYSDTYFYLYATEFSSYNMVTVGNNTMKNCAVKSILGQFRIDDIENNLDYILDVSDDPTPGYSSWVEGRLYDLSTFFATTSFNKIKESHPFINLRGLHNFYNRQHALDDIAYLKRSDLTSNNVLVLTKSQVEEYNLLTSTSTVSDSQLQSVSSSKLSGKVPLASMPAAALERVHSVADETERFALTTATVQNGDVIHQQDDHSQYYVIDAAKLNSADGYKKITKVALEVPWTGLTDKPVYFQPTPHSHGNITNDGKIGSTANLPLITGENGVITTSTFGTAAGTFCRGNDSRLSDAREPLNHGSDKVNRLTGYATTNTAGASISTSDTLNLALRKIEVKTANHKSYNSMSGYSAQTKAPVTTSDSLKVAIGKIEGGYLARKYATADDIDRALFGFIDYDYDAVYSMLEALGVSIDEDGNFHDIPINGYTATNEVLALNADGTVSHENSYPSSYTRKFGIESSDLISQNYLSNGKLYCKDQYYANNSNHAFSSAVQAVLNFFIVSKFAPSEIKQPIMLTNIAVGALSYGAIAGDKASGDPINCIIFDTEGHWGTVGYSNLSSTFANSLETTGIVTINSSTIYVSDSALSYVNLYIYNGNSTLYGFYSGTSGWRSEVQLNVQSVVNYLSYVLALKNTTISAVLAMPFYSA